MNAPAAGPLNRIDLITRYREVRDQTEHLCAPLATDDYQIQSVLETSPPKWHLAHVSWFFETFLLAPQMPDYRPFTPGSSISSIRTTSRSDPFIHAPSAD